MKKFYQLKDDDGYNQTHIAYYETYELMQEAIKSKYGETGNTYIYTVEHEMYTTEDKVAELEDKKIISGLSKQQIAAIKRNISQFSYD